MLKRLLVAFALFIVMVFGGIEIWLASYRVTDPAKAEQIYNDTVVKVRARDALAQDTGKNGFGDFQKLLQIRPDEDGRPCYKALSDWSYPATGKKDSDILVAYGTSSRKIREAVKVFESVLPTVIAVLAKTNFLWPSELDQGPNRTPRPFLEMRALAQNLVGYSEYCEVTGKHPQALNNYLWTLEFGSKVGQNGGLMPSMIGIGINAIGLEGAIGFLGRSPELTREDYRSALARLEALPLTPQTFLDRMDEEYVLNLITVDILGKNRNGKTDESSVGDLLLKLPGLLARERKVLQNIYLAQRPSIEKLHPPFQDGTDVQNLVKRSRSMLAAILVPNSDRAVIQFDYALTRIGGFKLLCGIELYNLEQGSYPDTLEQLVPRVLKVLPQNFANDDGKFTYKRRGDDFELSLGLSPTTAKVFGKKGAVSIDLHPPPPRK
ncbi:MAG: hypothetical protein HYU64_00410 [Armatimonadetes bacterium]|nr:hypothetical protein [Armatimonadota bacterium]